MYHCNYFPYLHCFTFQLNKSSKSPSVHFGAGPTFYGSSASSGSSGAYLPYGTPSIQTYFQPTSQTSNNVSQLHSSSNTSTTNQQNFVTLSTTQPSINVSGGTPLHALTTRSPFQTSTTTPTTASPLFNSKKHNKGSFISTASTNNTTGGNSSVHRALSPSYEEDTVSRDLLEVIFSFISNATSKLSRFW